MSIYSVRSIHFKICKRIYAFAQTKYVNVHSPGVSYVRSSHNSLYQMVKKRTLEARTKLQPAKFPNIQPCVASKNTTCSSPTSSKPSSSQTHNPIVSSSSTVSSSSYVATSKESPCPPSTNTDTVNQNEPPKVHTCQNTKVLNAVDCNTPPKQSPPADGGGYRDGGGDGTGGKNSDQNKDSEKNKKLLMALLAALGAGGLLAWLLSRGGNNKKCPKDSVHTLPTKVPVSSSQLPKHVPYVLIGGGTAAFSAFRAIKSNDAKAKVLMITNEFRKPYMRPPLSKELWYSARNEEISKEYRFKQWTGAERSIYFEPEEFFVDPTKLMDTVNGGIAVAEGFTVKKIDPAKHIITLSDGYEIGYDECLIATGCSPKNLSVFRNGPVSVKEKVMVYRTPDDFDRLKRYADAKKSIAIIGNGFTGSELACSLANYSKDKGAKVYQIFPESGNMSRVLPDYLSKWTTQKIEAIGVCVLPNAGIKEVHRDESKLKLVLNNGSTILTDVVVVCVGCEANTSIADVSGLEVNRQLGGFVVNAELEARRNLFVAGDASCFYDQLLGRRRVEHHDHSVVSGRLAGENMVGKKKAYTHQSMFWSDLGPEIGYEGIGLVDASLPTVGVFALPSKADRNTDNLTEMRSIETDSSNSKQPNTNLPDIKCDVNDADNYGRGVIFYMKDDKIVGVLLWNLFNRIGLARTIINQNKKFDDLNEVAKLFEIHA